MATAAERQRRSRAHKKGDHSLCDPNRCDSAASAVDGPVTVAPVTPPVTDLVSPSEPALRPTGPVGDTEMDVVAFLEQLTFPEGDPRRILSRMALKAARRVDQVDASARDAGAAIRQLMTILSQLAEIPDQPAGPLDGTRARAAVRRLGASIGRAS
jgi:hypothetical protein